MAQLPDSRQRAPFAHQSSSLDLRASPQPSLRALPPQPQQWNPTSPTERAEKTLWAPTPLPRRSSNELPNGVGYGDNPYNPSPNGGTYSLDTPPSRRRSLPNPFSRSPSPSLFKLPPFSMPSFATIRFISLCFLWYACSAISNNTGKVILNNFKYPVTLTLVQFFFVSLLCALCSRKELGWTGRLRRPTRSILRGTLPLAAFQVGGHIFGSMAISRVPVSTVHTIKALSPLFTVMAYALLFGVSYSPATYFSLLPLTLGVMLACSFDISFSNFFGLVCALGSTIVFVSQNIFFKKIMPTNALGATETTATQKLDKINLLYFSSGMGFILMFPLWVYSDAWRLIDLWLHPVAKAGGPSIPFYFVLNGTVHFAQSLIAFALLSSTSPVTYSIASLVKRIAVICLAIVWFKQSVHFVQGMGIALTGVGLWMYNNAKRDVEKGEKRMRQVEAVRDGMLPTTKADQRILEGRGGGGGGGELAGEYKAVHSSPKPTYPNNYAHLPASTTAIKQNGFRLPPPAHPQTHPIAHHVDPVQAPYPSPPASTTSSPPTAPHLPPLITSRQRRMSNEGEKFRVPPLVAASRSPPTINEEQRGLGLDTKAVEASAFEGGKVGVVTGA